MYALQMMVILISLFPGYYMLLRKEQDLQSVGSSLHGYLAVVRSGESLEVISVSSLGGSANLVAYQGITNIFHQIIELLCIPGVVEELYKILSSCD